MRKRIVELVSQNFAKPHDTYSGWFIAHVILRQRNKVLEKAAVQLCNLNSNDHVLEIGFGPGIGLKDALKIVECGSGRVYGVELSLAMVKSANFFYNQWIKKGKLDISYGTVTQLPFPSNKFDKIFHVNCYYFWRDMPLACAELYRVLKPNSQILTTLNLKRLKENKQKGFMKYGSYDPLKYMNALELAGFQDIRIDYLNGYEAIYGNVHEKEDIKLIDEDIIKENTK